MREIISFSANKIREENNFGFLPENYSKFKYGADSIAQEFGYELAVKFISEILQNEIIDKQIVVLPSAYSHIRTASFYMKNYFVDKLNLYLFEKNLPPVEEAKIYRTVTYREDYGEMSSEDRFRLICGDKFHIDKEFLTDKLLIFIDDIKITGTHEKIILKMLDEFQVYNKCYMLYFAELEDQSINPKIENYLNNYFVKSLEDVDFIIRNDRFKLNTRVVKFILNSQPEECKKFIEKQSKHLISKIYFSAIGNSYQQFESYRINLDYIHNFLELKPFQKNNVAPPEKEKFAIDPVLNTEKENFQKPSLLVEDIQREELTTTTQVSDISQITEQIEEIKEIEKTDSSSGSLNKEPQTENLFNPKPNVQKFIEIKNGTVDVPYNFEITNYEIINIQEFNSQLEKNGLSFDATTYQIKGVPKYQGDFIFVFQFRYPGKIENRPVLEGGLKFYVNPNPKSLWQNLPTDKNSIYYREDSVKFKTQIQDKLVIAASQRGRSHAHKGDFRDDSFEMDSVNDWQILTVADGAGSAKYSRKGSEIACKTAVSILKEYFSKIEIQEIEAKLENYQNEKNEINRKSIGDFLYKTLGNAAFLANKKINEEAVKNNFAVKDFATTLIIGIYRKFDFGHFFASYWVGDGGIGIYQKNKSVKVLGEPDCGEFAGQTRFLTMQEEMQPLEIYKRLRFDIVDEFSAFILMTDGITDPKFVTENNLTKIEYWDKLWEDLKESINFDKSNNEIESQLLTWLDFWSAGNHDDRTIAILF